MPAAAGAAFPTYFTGIAAASPMQGTRTFGTLSQIDRCTEAELVEALDRGVVTVVFTKVTGDQEERRMLCTRNLSLTPLRGSALPRSHGEHQDGELIRVYEILPARGGPPDEPAGWRSFYFNTVNGAQFESELVTRLVQEMNSRKAVAATRPPGGLADFIPDATVIEWNDLHWPPEERTLGKYHPIFGNDWGQHRAGTVLEFYPPGGEAGEPQRARVTGSVMHSGRADAWAMPGGGIRVVENVFKDEKQPMYTVRFLDSGEVGYLPIVMCHGDSARYQAKKPRRFSLKLRQKTFA